MSGEQENRPRDEAVDKAEKYLWDPSAPPDAGIQRLEQSLGGLRLGRTKRVELENPEQVSVRGARRGRVGALMAAVLAMAAGVVWYVQHSERPSWEVVALAGAPTVDSSIVRDGSRLAKGDWLVTDAVSRASMTVASIGQVNVEPGSRVRLVESRDGRYQMELERGTIQAFITAPPRLFFVDTPSAQAIDLGCIYELTVLADGSSELNTRFGLVEMAGKADGKDVVSKVPSGAVCRTDVKRGPGTPRFEDVTREFAVEVDAFDAGTPGVVGRIVESARARDTLTLWHLLSRTRGEEQARVLGTMVALAGRPTGAADAKALAGDPAAMDAWWLYLREKW